MYLHMAGSSQPQHFFAAGCDFAIAVIFYSVLNLKAKINFANMLKIIRKSGKLRV